MTGLEAKNIAFSYNGRNNVIEDMSFTVNKGETWAVIGRNGAGKSTLLKCLCGLLRCHQGIVLINGIDIAKQPPKETARQIAFVPQGVNRAPPPFTVREYLMMARYPYRNFLSFKTREDDKCVDGALALTDTARLADRMMNTLSGGELQSALVAGAVAQETPFLILDEPTTYLDPYHQENIRRMIERAHAQRGTTVITVTHDVNLALSVHDNILALVDGKTFFRGTKKEFSVGAEDNLSKIFSVDFCAVERPDKTNAYLAMGGTL